MASPILRCAALRLVCFVFLCQPACHASKTSESTAATGGGSQGSGSSASYSIGGVASGLVGNATVRLNNGPDTLNVGNTTFVFSTFVKDAGNYNVTLATQPEGQVCTVTDGEGIVQGASVTDVRVSCTASTLSIGGTVTGLQPLTALTLMQDGAVLSVANNGAFTVPVGFSSGSDYNVQVWAHPAGAHCTVAQGAGTITDTNITNIAVSCASAPRPQYTFSTNQPATVEIGQPNFGTASTTLLRGPNTFWTTDRFNRYPYKAFAIPGGPLYIPDFWNYRVLVFNALPATNFANADGVLAGNNLTDQGTGLIYPLAVSGSPNQLVVSNQQSYTSIFTFSGFPVVDPNSYVTTGKIDYDCTQQGAGAIGYSDVAIFNNKLLALDTYYNRLLIWDPLPTDRNARIDPSGVFGQGNFNTCVPQTSAAGFSSPVGFYADNNHFIMADGNNNRVLIWNQSFDQLMTSGVSANVVLGQSNFTDGTDHGATASTFTPSSVDSDGTMLVVADMFHHRVLVWHTLPTQNNAPADAILGQADATSSSCNQSAISGTYPQAQTLCLPSGANIAGPFIIVNDTGNLRFNIFRSQ